MSTPHYRTPPRSPPQVHTTGMDIKHTASAEAVLTLSKDMTFRDYAQGAFRMRGIGAGQRIAQEGSARAIPHVGGVHRSTPVVMTPYMANGNAKRSMGPLPRLFQKWLEKRSQLWLRAILHGMAPLKDAWHSKSIGVYGSECSIVHPTIKSAQRPWGREPTAPQGRPTSGCWVRVST